MPDEEKNPVSSKDMPLPITKACDMCRKMKIRCQPTGEACFQCIKFKRICHFTPIMRNKGPRRRPGHKRVEELESRLKEVEEKLRRKANADSTNLDTDEGLESESSMQTSLPPCIEDRSLMILDESQDSDTSFPLELLDPMYELLHGVHSNGGMSSPAVLHRKEWTSNPDFQLTHVSNIFSRRIIKPLPPKAEAEYLISKAFQCLSCTCPIFDEASFMKRFESDESPYEDPGWWACLNVVFALAHRLRSMVCMNSEEEDRHAWGYYQNALTVLTELTMLHSSLSAVQALLGMATIVQGTPNPAPYASLANTAMRLAQTLNLHRSQENSGLPRELIEERKRVFWIAYFLDKEVSLRTRQSPVQDDEEMDVELPDLNKFESLADNLLSDRIGLAKIQGQVYKRLLSVSASRQSYPHRVAAIRDLESKLQDWRVNINIDFRREYFRDPLTAPLAHTVILRLLYFTTLDAIHSAYPSLGNTDAASAERQMEIYALLPPPIRFVKEARKAIKLLHVTPQGDYACIWIVLHIFVSATKTLLNHLLTEPNDPLALTDLQLIDPMLKLLGMLAKGEESVEVMMMYTECSDLFEKAKEEVENHMHQVVPWVAIEENLGGEGNRQEKESVEDFIRRIESISAGYDDPSVDLDSEIPALHPNTFQFALWRASAL